MIMPTDVLLQAQYGTAAPDQVQAMVLICMVLLFLSLLANFADGLSRWTCDLILLATGTFAFLIWWPVLQDAALPLHFV